MLYFVPPVFVTHRAHASAGSCAGMSDADIWMLFILAGVVVLILGLVVVNEYSKKWFWRLLGAILYAIALAIAAVVAVAGYSFFYAPELFFEWGPLAAGLLACTWLLGLLFIMCGCEDKTAPRTLAAHFGAFAIVFGFALAVFVGHRYFGTSLEEMRSFGFPVIAVVPLLFLYAITRINGSDESGKDRKTGKQDKLAGPGKSPALTDSRGSSDPTLGPEDVS